MPVDDVKPVMQTPKVMFEVVRHRRNGGGQRTAGVIQVVFVVPPELLDLL
jgi:hypothetical protein